MFSVELTFGVVLYPLIGVLLVCTLWWFYDRRDQRYYDRTRRRSTFHCLKCQHVYTSTAREDLANCPRCGHPNSRLHF